MISNIEKLIEELCPEGVEFRELGEVCEFNRGRSITQKDVVVGEVPVIAGGQKPAYYHNYHNRIGETISISGSGAYAGFVSFWNIPVFLSDSFSVNPSSELLLTKYVYYFLLSIQALIYSKKKGSGVPHVHGKDIAKFSIPILPLEVQGEIVRILDRFTELEAELEAELKAELKARRTQYEYYRDELLSENYLKNHCRDGLKLVALGEIGEFVRGNGLQKKDFVDSGVGCIHYGQIYTYYGTYADKTKSFVSVEFSKKLRKAKRGDLIIATTSETIEDVCKAVAWIGDEEIAVSGDAYIFKHNQNPKYLSYCFQTAMFCDHKQKYITGTKVTRVSGINLAKYHFPLPSLSEQERIVSILDKFDKLVNDITEGLPAEIAARRQQYEHYRAKLLDFKNINA